MIGSIARKEIHILLKEKGTFFWLFLLPILFIVMFASIFGNANDSYAISYYDADGSPASGQFVQQLTNIPGFSWKTDTTLTFEEQLKKIKDGRATSLLVIPKGYGDAQKAGKPAELEFYRDAAADTAVAPAMAVLHNVTTDFREIKLKGILKASGQSDADIEASLAPPLKVNEIKENSAKTTAISQVVPGYTVMFVFFIIITMVRGFIKDKESGMLSRLRSTPMKPYQYLIGMWIPNIAVVLIQSLVLLFFGRIVYGLNLGDIFSILLIVAGLAVCATGIGLALSMLVRSENQGVAYTQIITMGGAIVAGLWFPYDFLPAFAQAIGKFTPQYWAQRGFQDVMIRGAHADGIWLTVVILFAFGAAGLLVATSRFKRFMHAAVN